MLEQCSERPPWWSILCPKKSDNCHFWRCCYNYPSSHMCHLSSSQLLWPQPSLTWVHIGHTASDTCAPPTHFYDRCHAALKARTSYRTFLIPEMPHSLFLWVKYHMLRQSGGGWKDLAIKSLQPTPSNSEHSASHPLNARKSHLSSPTSPCSPLHPSSSLLSTQESSSLNTDAKHSAARMPWSLDHGRQHPDTQDNTSITKPWSLLEHACAICVQSQSCLEVAERSILMA